MLRLQTCTKIHSVYIGDVDLNLGNKPETAYTLPTGPSSQSLNSILNTVTTLRNIRCLRVPLMNEGIKDKKREEKF